MTHAHEEGKHPELLKRRETSWRRAHVSVGQLRRWRGAGKELPAGAGDVTGLFKAPLRLRERRHQPRRVPACRGVSAPAPFPASSSPGTHASVETHPADGRERWQHREIPHYGRNQANGDLSWRLTGLFVLFCFSSLEIEFPEPERIALQVCTVWGRRKNKTI